HQRQDIDSREHLVFVAQADAHAVHGGRGAKARADKSLASVRREQFGVQAPDETDRPFFWREWRGRGGRSSLARQRDDVTGFEHTPGKPAQPRARAGGKTAQHRVQHHAGTETEIAVIALRPRRDGDVIPGNKPGLSRPINWLAIDGNREGAAIPTGKELAIQNVEIEPRHGELNGSSIGGPGPLASPDIDRKSTRLNS